MREAMRKTNLLLRFHPVLWGLWIFCVLFAALFGFQLVLAVPFVTLFGMLVYVNSSCNEIEYIVPLEDSEMTEIRRGGVGRICRFGAIAGICGLGLHFVYLLSTGYGRNATFVRIMDFLDVRFQILSEIGFGVGSRTYGELDLPEGKGIGAIKGVFPQMLCVIVLSALCFALGMLLLYRLGLSSANNSASKNDGAAASVRKPSDIIFQAGLALYLMVGIGLMAFRVVLFGRLFVFWLILLALMIVCLLLSIRSIRNSQCRFEYTPERTDG